jgi:hypothetical protein
VDSTAEILREPVVGEGGEPGEPFPLSGRKLIKNMHMYQVGRRLTRLTIPHQLSRGQALNLSEQDLTSAEVKLASGKVA